MKIRALLTAGFAAALVAGAFAAPGSAGASAARSANTQRVSAASFGTASGGIAIGKAAGILPARGAGLGGEAAPQVGAAPASCSEPNCNLTYHGGPTQHASRVYLMFWGPKWNTNATDKAAKNYLIAFYKGLGQSAWLKTMAQYGDKSGRPALPRSLFAGSHTVTSNPPRSVTANNIGNEAYNAALHNFGISAGAAHNAQIVVALQSGTCFAAIQTSSGTINFSGNCGTEQSGLGYCGYHNVDLFTGGVYLPWVALPFQLDAKHDCGENFINATSRGKLDGFSITSGHETAETITDPVPAIPAVDGLSAAWIDINDNVSGGEVADKCAWKGSAWNQSPPDAAGNIALSTGSFAAQSLWSNLLNRCVISGALPIKINFIPNQVSKVGKAVRLQVVASTTPKVALSFGASGLPTGLHMSKTGLISGTPRTVRKFKVMVTITYITGSKSFTFLWTVNK